MLQGRILCQFLIYQLKLEMRSIWGYMYILAAQKEKLVNIWNNVCGRGSRDGKRDSCPGRARIYWSRLLHRRSQHMPYPALISQNRCVMILVKWLTGSGGLNKKRRIKCIGSHGKYYAVEKRRGSGLPWPTPFQPGPCWLGKPGGLWWNQTPYVLDSWWPNTVQRVQSWRQRRDRAFPTHGEA